VRDGEGGERGQRETRDREESLRDARVPEARQEVPERLVERRVRAECKHDRHEHADSEHRGEPAVAPPDER